MPVEVSVLEVALLGALVACLLFAFALLVFGWVIVRRALAFAEGFRSVGAERVHGRVQVKGLFDDNAHKVDYVLAPEPPSSETLTAEDSN